MAYPAAASAAEYLEFAASPPAITAARAGQYEGVDRVFDTVSGNWDGFLVLDISALDVGDADEVYTFKLELSDDVTFNTGVNEFRSVSVLTTGQQALVISNQINSVAFRYMRLVITPAGTTPSVTLTAWVVDEASLDDYTLAQVTRLMAVAVARWTETSVEFRNWANGSATGGPNSDGQYPLSDGAGNSHLVDCPAKIAISAAANLSTSSVMDLTEHTTPLADPEDPMPQMIGVVDPGGGGEALRRFPIDLFAARKTADLQEFTALVGDELIPAINASTGIEGKVALSELMRSTFGVINPALPPYNCKFDAVFHRDNVSTSAGSPNVNCTDPIFDRAVPGQTIQLSNAAASSKPFQSTILSVIDDNNIVMADNAVTAYGDHDCLYGTVNTAGMQQALLDARALSTYTYGGVVMLPPGGCLTGHLRYYERAGLFGRGVRQSTLYRHDDDALSPAWYQYRADADTDGLVNEDDPDFVPDQPAPLLQNINRWVDFPAMGDFTLHGARFCQGKAYANMAYLGAYSETPQVDPYPMFSRMHSVSAGWTGWVHEGRHSGSMIAVEIIDCGEMGFRLQGFDANITNILVIGCEGPGLFLPSYGSNNNILNAKVSFNGKGTLTYFLSTAIAGCNVAMQGKGNQITNMRCQESFGSNLVIDGGFGNQFGDIGLDDTGCVYYHHGQGNYASLPNVRAALLLRGDAHDNRFNDVIFGGSVHPDENYAVNGVYVQENGGNAPYRNTGRMSEKYDGIAYETRDTTTTPGLVDDNVTGGIAASNTLTIDDTAIGSL